MIHPTRQSGQRVHTFDHRAMACVFGLCIVHEDARYARQFARAAFDEIDRLELLLSRFIPHSEIAQLNRLAPGVPLRVSEATLTCLQLASELHAATAGAFDITYRQCATRGDAVGPPLVFDPQAHAVGVTAPVDIDLGGLGKGHAIDQVVGLLREWQIEAALVHSGQSTAYALGAPPDANGWTLHLRDPDNETASLGTLILRDQAVAGSGQQLHGVHIINPHSNAPVDQTAAAWALAPSAAIADGLSTAMMILGPDDARDLCKRESHVWAILRRPAAHAGLLHCPAPPACWRP